MVMFTISEIRGNMVIRVGSEEMKRNTKSNIKSNIILEVVTE